MIIIFKKITLRLTVFFGIILLLLPSVTYSKQINNAIKISAGSRHSVLLKDDGTVWSWGRNSSGQLGDGTLINSSIPIKIKDLEDVIDIEAGSDFTIALKKDGSLWRLGANPYTVFAAVNPADFPIRIEDPLDSSGYLTGVKSISAADSHVMLLKNDGSVWTFGDNRFGQLGNGAGGNYNTSENEKFPVRVKDPLDPTGYLTNIIAISGNGFHSLALKNDGTVLAWGSNSHNELGIENRGNKIYPVKVPSLNNVIGISTGFSRSAALKDDGTVWTWGNMLDNDSQETPTKIENLNNIKVININSRFGYALKTDGTVWEWEYIYYKNEQNIWEKKVSLAKKIELLENVLDIKAGANHCLALLDDGRVYAWGNNYDGQLGYGTTIDSKHPEPVLDEFLGFKDTINHWANKEINYITGRQIITGYRDSTFRPEEKITRAQFAIIINRALHNHMGLITDKFSDVPASHWAANSIGNVFSKGYMNGYNDGTFRPEKNLTRAEMAAILVRVYNLQQETDKQAFTDVENGHWANKEISIASSNGIILGYTNGKFKPEQLITRAEAVAMLFRIYN